MLDISVSTLMSQREMNCRVYAAVQHLNDTFLILFVYLFSFNVYKSDRDILSR